MSHPAWLEVPGEVATYRLEPTTVQGKGLHDSLLGLRKQVRMAVWTVRA